MTLLVEFLGLPGVGKSEVSHRVAEHLRSAGHSIRQPSHALAHDLSPSWRRLRKSAHMLRELLLHPLASWKAMRGIAATRQRSHWSGFMLVCNWLLVMDLARQARRRNGVSLFDQGLLQAVWSVALDGHAEPAFDLLAVAGQQVPLPQVVVVVEADLATVQQRLQGRSRRDSRLERDVDRMPELLARGEQLLRQIRSVAARRYGTQFLVLGNGAHADLQQLADRLAIDLELLAAAATRTQPG